MCGWGMGGSSFLSSDCLLALSCAPYALKKPCSEKVKHKIGIPCDAFRMPCTFYSRVRHTAVPCNCHAIWKRALFFEFFFPNAIFHRYLFLALYCSQNAFGHSVENAVFGVFCMCSWKSNFAIIYLLKKSVWKENKAIMLCCANSRQKGEKKLWWKQRLEVGGSSGCCVFWPVWLLVGRKLVSTIQPFLPLCISPCRAAE